MESQFSKQQIMQAVSALREIEELSRANSTTLSVNRICKNHHVPNYNFAYRAIVKLGYAKETGVPKRKGCSLNWIKAQPLEPINGRRFLEECLHLANTTYKKPIRNKEKKRLPKKGRPQVDRVTPSIKNVKTEKKKAGWLKRLIQWAW